MEYDYDAKNISSQRGLKNAFSMPLTPLLYLYLSVLWQNPAPLLLLGIFPKNTIFLLLLFQLGPRGLNSPPPPSYSQPDCKMSAIFDAFPVGKKDILRSGWL